MEQPGEAGAGAAPLGRPVLGAEASVSSNAASLKLRSESGSVNDLPDGFRNVGAGAAESGWPQGRD